MEGVVLLPSLFGITTGSFPSITATHEFVVPRSIPIIFPILLSFYDIINSIYDYDFLFAEGSFNHCAKGPIREITVRN
jgi:hypothetical protein